MADHKKGIARSVLDFGVSHVVDLATLWHVAKGNKAPDESPPWVKAAENSPGGEGDPADEAAYAHFVSKIGTPPNYSDRGDLQVYLRKWVTQAYQLEDAEKHVRDRGRKLQSEWRVIINKISIEYGEQTAISYLTSLAKDIRRAYHNEVKARGHDISSIKSRQKKICWEAACHTINVQMLGDGIHVPGEVSAPYTVQIKHFFKNKVAPFSKEVFQTAQYTKRKWWTLSRRKGKPLIRKSVLQTRKTAGVASDWIEQHAEERESLDASRRRWTRWIDWLL